MTNKLKCREQKWIIVLEVLYNQNCEWVRGRNAMQEKVKDCLVWLMKESVSVVIWVGWSYWKIGNNVSDSPNWYREREETFIYYCFLQTKIKVKSPIYLATLSFFVSNKIQVTLAPHLLNWFDVSDSLLLTFSYLTILFHRCHLLSFIHILNTMAILPPSFPCPLHFLMDS